MQIFRRRSISLCCPEWSLYFEGWFGGIKRVSIYRYLTRSWTSEVIILIGLLELQSFISQHISINKWHVQSVVKFRKIVYATVQQYWREVSLQVCWLLLLLLLISLVLHLLIVRDNLSKKLVSGLILAWFALTVLRTTDSGIVALTVALQTVRFFTVTPFFWKRTVASTTLLDSNLGIYYGLLESRCVFAVDASTVIPTFLSLCEAFTVHFEAEGLFASTTDFAFFGRLGCSFQMWDSFHKGILLL